MKTDLYTKIILTVIAVALVWIGVKDFTFATTAQAADVQPVRIVGYSLSSSTDGIPVIIKQSNYSGPVDVRIKEISKGYNSLWEPLPVTIQK